MTEHLGPDETAARVQPVDSIGMPLGRGQPPGLIEALEWFDAGAVSTTPRHQVDIIVTEHGADELQGKTVRQRGEALAAIAHPAFREELREAADRASHGRAPVPA